MEKMPLGENDRQKFIEHLSRTLEFVLIFVHSNMIQKTCLNEQRKKC